MQVVRFCKSSLPVFLTFLAALAVLFFNPFITKSNSQEGGVIKKPQKAKVENVVETIHGQKVEDPYRWLENSQDEQTKFWVGEQNQYTRDILDNLPSQPKIKARLEELFSIGWIDSPRIYQGRYFYLKREGKQDQPILYVRDGAKGKDRVLIDPNALDEEGLVALDWWYPSDDGKLLAYGLSEGGDEQSTLYIMNVETGEKLPDVITRTRYTSLSWKKDNTGFFYSRLPAPGTVPQGEEKYHQHVYYHQLGRNPDEDPKLYGEGRDMTDWLSMYFSRDNAYVLLSIFMGWDKSDIYFQKLQGSPEMVKGENFIPVVVGKDAIFNGQIVGDFMYIHTNYQAPKYRFLKVDLKAPAEENWKELIPEDESVLQQVIVVGDRLVAQYMHNAYSRLKIFTLSGKYLTDIELPTLGTVYGVDGEWDGTEVTFTFNSYFFPPTIYLYDFKTDQLSIFDQVKSNLDTAPYEVKQVWYPSKDGTKVSMFVVHKKGLKLDGNNPVLLEGYGGFNSASTPVFQRNTFLWLENGGVYAEANLRGGSEYGEEWHKGGMLGNKQNTFDDFIAAGEWLISNGYTNPSKLAIKGGSNGGLLVGAVLTQRPELFKAVICWNPLLDMIRYQNFLIAKLWVPEYGSSEDPVQFKWLYAYSPYHHVQDGTAYPATLFMTGDSDSRCDPMHAVKMTARVQAANSSDSPILLRYDTKSGHAGMPMSKSLAEHTDVWSFVFWQLGMEY